MNIKWNRLAVKQLMDAIEYLEENDLFEYAVKIETEILSKISFLPQTYSNYQTDRLKRKNDGSFYAFEVDRYRISYRKLPKEIRILRIRHSSRRPFTR
jgi:plasmid stabilization system protein ParE